MKKTYMFLVLLVIAVFVISAAFAENSLNGKSADGKLKKEKDIKISDNKVIEKEGKGKINFKNSFDVEIEDVEDNPNVYITNDLIAINTEELPELNQPATITFYNLPFETMPTIYYNLKLCSKTESCSTCEGTTACERNYCASNSFMSCLSSNCPQNPSSCWAWADCMKQASESCLTADVDYGLPESHWCQPKVCDADDVEVGQCYYEGDNYNLEQTVNIGAKICADKKQWQVCVEGDGDPCGEWEILEDDEIEVTTTDMYGLDPFTVDVCAGNPAPAININIVSQYANVCNDLTCEAEISDDCSSSFDVEYKITGGHGSLAGTMPEITGTTTCSGNPCEVTIPIPKQYTFCDDVIKCEITAKDECGASTIQSADTNGINGVDACGS